ncbi:MAG: thiamine pyrophosphate-dependent enzyme [Gemmatimonadales bacterium]|nr:thiamine pyrophosphate-dependent enzyme [Gemmatimonadales bacterium]
MDCYVRAIQASNVPLDKHVVVSGIGCTGRIAGYLNLDSFHTTHGRAIPFATGLKLAKPELEVTVISGDGDLFAIGGNHFLHAARRNTDLLVVCVNNFNYGMTGGQAGPTTPVGSRTSTTPKGASDAPFNLQHLAIALGASFSARWTALHLRQLRSSFARALQLKGFRFVEVLSPCPVGFGKANNLGEGIDEMNFYRSQGVVDQTIEPEMARVEMSHTVPLPLGIFADGGRKRNTLTPQTRRVNGAVTV